VSHVCPLPSLTFPDVDLSESVSYHYGRLQEGRSCVDLAMRTRQWPFELESVGQIKMAISMVWDEAGERLNR